MKDVEASTLGDPGAALALVAEVLSSRARFGSFSDRGDYEDYARRVFSAAATIFASPESTDEVKRDAVDCIDYISFTTPGNGSVYREAHRLLRDKYSNYTRPALWRGGGGSGHLRHGNIA